MSPHTPRGEDAHSKLGDLIEDTEAIPPADAITTSLLQVHFEAALALLPQREAAVIRMRFGLTDGAQQTLKEIGRIQGLTRERIRQVEREASSKLRHPTHHTGLRDPL